MQSTTEPKNCLVCADCKSSFTSASSLLQHFAQHISESRNKDACNKKSTSECQKMGTSHMQKGKKKESILESVLKRSAMHHLVNQQSPITLDKTNNVRTFHSDSSSSSISHSSQNSRDSSNSDVLDNKDAILYSDFLPEQTMVLEIGQRAKEKCRPGTSNSSNITLLKFDLQKRLENCVLKLASKQENCEDAEMISSIPLSSTDTFKRCISLETGPTDLLVEKSVKPFHNESTKALLAEMSTKADKIVVDSDEINPLKFCIVTFKESEENIEVEESKPGTDIKEETQVLKACKGASNRKQQMPKKVLYQSTDKQKDCTAVKSQVISLPVTSCNTSSNEKPLPTKRKYPCHLCSKVFGWSTDLKRHILTHTGERPFKCQICNATFTRNFLLQKHESRIHNLNVSDTKKSENCAKQNKTACSAENGTQEKAASKSIPSIKDDKERITELKGKNVENVNNCLTSLKRNAVNGCWDEKYSSKKRKLQCNDLTSYIFSHTALNI